MGNIKKWLKENEFEFKEIELVNSSGNIIGIMVDTNYLGEYPTKETMNKINIISRKINRSKKLQCEVRGFYTGVLITERGTND